MANALSMVLGLYNCSGAGGVFVRIYVCVSNCVCITVPMMCITCGNVVNIAHCCGRFVRITSTRGLLRNLVAEHFKQKLQHNASMRCGRRQSVCSF